MANTRAAFDVLFDLLQQVSDEEIDLALDIVRRYSADVSLETYPPHLVGIVAQIPEEARAWFATVLCVRAQQTERKEAWSRFAESAYRELASWPLD